MRLTNEGQLEVRKEIKESWNRCIQNNISPFMKTNYVIFKPEQLEQKRKENKELLDVAIPIIQKRASQRIGKNVYGLDSEVLDIFLNYSWPGNIRELQNVIERAVILATEPVVTKNLLPTEVITNSLNNFTRLSSVRETGNSIREIEKQAIFECLIKHGNKKEVARHLGISRSTLYRKMKEYGIK